MKITSIRNTKIKTKLLVLGAISIGGLILMGIESTLTARQMNQASTDMSKMWLPSIIIAEELNTATSDYRLKENEHVIAVDPEMMEEIELELQTIRIKIENGFESYKYYITNEKDRQMMGEARELWNDYLECSDRLLETSKSRETEKALQIIREESKELFERASGLFLQVVEFNKQGAEHARIQSEALYRSLNRMKLMFIFFIGAMITSLVIYIIRSIETPVDAIVEGARRVSNGDLDVHLEYQSEDEIGVLTGSVNALISRLNDIIRDERNLLHEIGNENYEAQSSCQQAYRGDFAPILYAITSLQSRLKQSQMNQKNEIEVPEIKATIERIQVKPRRKNKRT